MEPLIIAHRGASADAPENTVAAFRLAWEQGADAIELDVQLTVDGQLVCIHDERTGRTAGVDLAVADATLEELRRLDVGRAGRAQWRGLQIPTFAEAIDTVPAGKSLFVEIKGRPDAATHVRDALEATTLDPACITVLSFSDHIVKAARRAMPTIRAGLNVEYKRGGTGGDWVPQLEDILQRAAAVDATAVCVESRPFLDEAYASALRAAHLGFYVWTVNSAADAHRYAALRVDGLVTDRPSDLSKIGELR